MIVLFSISEIRIYSLSDIQEQLQSCKENKNTLI
jgi:hypothetical protein